MTEEEYLNNLENPEFVPIVKDFFKEWRSIGGDIHFGTVGFSAIIETGGKRTPIQLVYQKKITVLSDKWRINYGISNKGYERYK